MNDDEINITYLKPVFDGLFCLKSENTYIRGTDWNTRVNTMENRKRGKENAKHRFLLVIIGLCCVDVPKIDFDDH